MARGANKTTKVLVASGPGWSLYWPRHLWEALTPQEQQDVRDRQAALLQKAGHTAAAAERRVSGNIRDTGRHTGSQEVTHDEEDLQPALV